MTANQQIVIEKLLAGFHIAAAGDRYRLRDPESRLVRIVPASIFSWLRRQDLLRRNKQRWFLDKRAIRRMHGNSCIKRLYKGKPLGAKTKNTPPRVQRQPRPMGPTLF